MTQMKLSKVTSIKTLRVLAVSVSAAVLAACATATPYQEASKPGAYDGFSQTLIENDRARVSFGGNSLTDRDTVENYLIYRSAEIAKERGFDHFTLQERDVEEKTRISGSSYGHGLYDPFFNYSFYGPSFGWSRGGRFSSFGGRGFRGAGFRGSRFGGSGFGFGGGFNNFHAREITKYRATAEVKFGRGAEPDDVNSFNTNEVLENLSSAITYPEIKT